jgi:hypothetical protein
MAAVVAKLAARDMSLVWDEESGFEVLLSAGRQLVGTDGLAPEEAALAVFDACATSGHASFLTDYVQQICCDPSTSTVTLKNMAMFDGGLVHRWLKSTCQSLDSELRTMCTTGNGMSDRSLVSRLRAIVLCCFAVNTALLEAGMRSRAVSIGVPHASPSTHL